MQILTAATLALAIAAQPAVQDATIVQWSDLAQFSNETVRVTTDTGTSYHGLLRDIAGDRLVIFERGDVREIPRDELCDLAVFRRLAATRANDTFAAGGAIVGGAAGLRLCNRPECLGFLIVGATVGAMAGAIASSLRGGTRPSLRWMPVYHNPRACTW